MANLLHLHVALRYIQPPIWRRVEVPDTLTFWDLHFVLQLLFDWENSHLFEFRQGRGTPSEFLASSPLMDAGDAPEWERDPREVPLSNVLNKPKDKLTYVYDFGDYWEHDIVVEKVVPLVAGHPTPAVRCLDGRRAAPPEDIGGFPGYEGLLHTLAEKAAGLRKRMPSEYAGLGKFDPEEFPLADYNHDLGLLREIVAEETAILANYAQQYAAPQAASSAISDPAFDLNAFLKGLSASTPMPRQAQPKPNKPKK